MVRPSAWTRDTIVILCTGSVCSRKWPTSAWPISWYAVIRCSFSESRRAFFSGPAITRMIPSSSSSCSITFLPRRAASSAASLIRLRRSAPVNPGVPAAGVAVGAVDDDLTVEAARAQQCGLEDVRPVRRGDQDDVVLHLEAVHLDEQLVQRLLALVVPAAEPRAAMAADGVEHLDEVGARDAEERDASFARDGAREQCLTGARWAVEENALRDPRAERLELLRVLEELLDLLQLLDRLVHPGHVLEADLRRVGRHPLRARLPEAHHLRAAALHLVHEEDPEAEQEHERQQAREDRPPRRRADALRIEV